MFNQRHKNKNNREEKYMEDVVGGDGGSYIYIYNLSKPNSWRKKDEMDANVPHTWSMLLCKHGASIGRYPTGI